MLELLPLLKKLKYKELELDFSHRVDEVSSEAALQFGSVNGVPSLQASVLPSVERLVEVSPRSAVMEAWRLLDAAAYHAARHLGWQGPSQKASNALFTFKFLEQQSQVDRATVSLLRDLNSIRNQAAHTPDFAITKEAALEYSSTCARLVGYLELIASGQSDAART